MKRLWIALAVVVLAVFPGSAAATAANGSDYTGAADAAISKIGKGYVFGGTGPNAFDASGLVLWSYRQISVQLPRSARAQYEVTRPIRQDELQKGDLVFSYNKSHVAIYDGDGLVIDATPCVEPQQVPGKDCAVARRPLPPGGNPEPRTYRK